MKTPDLKLYSIKDPVTGVAINLIGYNMFKRYYKKWYGNTDILAHKQAMKLNNLPLYKVIRRKRGGNIAVNIAANPYAN